MFAVMWFDEATQDDTTLFTGTYEECVTFIDGDEECFIVAPDGFTVVE